jgi:hypothetical protein
MIIPVKVMAYSYFLKMRKNTLLCPKQLPVDEYSGESRLPCGEYIAESPFPGLFITSIRTGLQKTTSALYNRESRLHCVFILGESWLPGVFGTSKCFCKSILDNSHVANTVHRGIDYEYEELHEYLTKIEILSRHV